MIKIKTSSAKRRKRASEKINLVPILDAVFIFIFYLLSSSQMVKIYQQMAPIPAVSNTHSPTDKIPLQISVFESENHYLIKKGSPSKEIFRVSKADLKSLNSYLNELKLKHTTEETIYLHLFTNSPYHQVVALMDAVRFKIYQSFDQTTLFNDIVFSNIENPL